MHEHKSSLRTNLPPASLLEESSIHRRHPDDGEQFRRDSEPWSRSGERRLRLRRDRTFTKTIALRNGTEPHSPRGEQRRYARGPNAAVAGDGARVQADGD